MLLMNFLQAAKRSIICQQTNWSRTAGCTGRRFITKTDLWQITMIDSKATFLVCGIPTITASIATCAAKRHRRYSNGMTISDIVLCSINRRAKPSVPRRRKPWMGVHVTLLATMDPLLRIQGKRISFENPARLGLVSGSAVSAARRCLAHGRHARDGKIGPIQIFTSLTRNPSLIRSPG